MEDRRGFDRLVYLSDAVVAIAVTLLILPLVDTAGELARAGGTRELLDENRDKLLAFVLSFAVIARLWMAHHQIFARLRGFDTPIVVANFVWLFCIVFLPFPTELIGSGSSDALAETLYVGTLAAATVTAATIQWLASRDPEVQLGDGVPLRRGPSSVAAVGMVIALLLVAFTGAHLWALFVLVPLSLANRLVRRLRGRGTSAG